MNYFDEEGEVLEVPERVKIGREILELIGFNIDSEGNPSINPSLLTQANREFILARVRALQKAKRKEDTDHLATTFNNALTLDASHEDLRALQAILEDMKPETPPLVVQNLLSKQDAAAWQRDWLIPGWLPANTVTYFSGRGGLGKSWMALQHVAAITMGLTGCALYSQERNQCPKYSPGPCNVVFATWEDEREEVSSRLNTICETLIWPCYGEVGKRFHYVDLKQFGPAWGPDQDRHVSVRGSLLKTGQQLLKICEDMDARLLVVDPLAGAFGGNENDRAAVREFVSYVNGWGNESKCATLFIAHPPKSKESLFSGSTDWEGSARSMWALTLEEEKELDDKGKSNKTKGTGKEIVNRFFAFENTKSNYTQLQPRKFLGREHNGVWFELESKEDAIKAYKDYTEKFESEENYACAITEEDY